MSQNKFFYTSERNAQILIALLKAHKIRTVIASPGTTNICFVASLQNDPHFKVYSAADERSAGYMACGFAAELNEPVVLSCTGATASRNYMPALTEAYYRKLPILAVTSSRRSSYIGHNIDQVTDRTLLPRDVAKTSVQMPLVNDNESEWACTIAANKALLELNHHGYGPVHINLETDYSRDYSVKELPPVQEIYRFTYSDSLPKIKAKKIAILVGAHIKWTKELTELVESFCEKYNGIVVCDQISNYKGKYRVFANFATQQTNFQSEIKTADLVIDIGCVTASKYGIAAKEVWRVNPDGELRDTYRKLHYVFEMEEVEFFKTYTSYHEKSEMTFWKACQREQENLSITLENTANNLPFSNLWVASQVSSVLPPNAVLHLGIQNSLRSWNFFDVPNSILGYSNTGGFGIDGTLSATIGAALANQDKIYFCVLGDLAFFYDMNSLGNRHVGQNIRIILVNNGKGAEFKLTTNPGAMFGNDADTYIAAGGHYGKKSKHLVKHYAEDLGFEYMSASTKEEFSGAVNHFTSPNVLDKPIIFEIFTDSQDDVEALAMMRSAEMDVNTDSHSRAKNALKSVLGEKGIKTVKSLLRK
ncbi:MAG: thiamine pyrophosphate-binding protein [Lachnospiraceae bacterium]